MNYQKCARGIFCIFLSMIMLLGVGCEYASAVPKEIEKTHGSYLRYAFGWYSLKAKTVKYVSSGNRYLPDVLRYVFGDRITEKVITLSYKTVSGDAYDMYIKENDFVGSVSAHTYRRLYDILNERLAAYFPNQGDDPAMEFILTGSFTKKDMLIDPVAGLKFTNFDITQLAQFDPQMVVNIYCNLGNDNSHQDVEAVKADVLQIITEFHNDMRLDGDIKCNLEVKNEDGRSFKYASKYFDKTEKYVFVEDYMSKSFKKTNAHLGDTFEIGELTVQLDDHYTINKHELEDDDGTYEADIIEIDIYVTNNGNEPADERGLVFGYPEILSPGEEEYKVAPLNAKLPDSIYTTFPPNETVHCKLYFEYVGSGEYTMRLQQSREIASILLSVE